MAINTLIVGDSFVHDIVTTYADVAKKQIANVDIIGIPGAGNDAIANTVLSKFNDYDNVIINWTSTCRYDLQLSSKSIIKNFRKGTSHAVIDNKFWLFSGGWRGNWQNESSGIVFKHMYANHFDTEDSWRRTLHNIIMVQKTLSQQNKQHLSIFSYDTFISQSFCDYEKQYQATRQYDKQKWQNYLNDNSYTNFVDWASIWFHKNKYSNTGGVMDWCHDNTKDTSHHPSNQGHQAFYQYVIQPWIEQHN